MCKVTTNKFTRKKNKKKQEIIKKQTKKYKVFKEISSSCGVDVNSPSVQVYSVIYCS